MPAGRRPLPVALKKQRGTYRPSRDKDPVDWPSAGVPRPPAYLDAAGKREWRRLAPLLAEQGLLPSGALSELGMLCSAWSTFLRAEKELREHGHVIATKTGYSQPNPWCSLRRQAIADVSNLAARFGLDPMTANKVTAAPKVEEDPYWADLPRKSAV